MHFPLTFQGMELIENLNKAMRNVLQSALITHDDLTNGLALFDEVAFINYGYYGDGEIRINSSLTVNVFSVFGTMECFVKTKVFLFSDREFSFCLLASYCSSLLWAMPIFDSEKGHLGQFEV